MKADNLINLYVYDYILLTITFKLIRFWQRNFSLYLMRLKQHSALPTFQLKALVVTKLVQSYNNICSLGCLNEYLQIVTHSW